MKKLNEIQQKLKVPKGHRNTFANYDYRNAEDILEAVKPLLGEAVLTLNDEIVQLGDRYYVKSTASLLDAEEKFTYTTSGYAREPLEKKGSDASQITGAASSYARKYALCGLFCIDDGEDADNQDNTQAKPAAKPAAPDKVEKERNAKKKLIADLLLKSATDPLVPMETKEQFEEQCRIATGLELVPDNYDEIIQILEK